MATEQEGISTKHEPNEVLFEKQPDLQGTRESRPVVVQSLNPFLEDLDSFQGPQTSRLMPEVKTRFIITYYVVQKHTFSSRELIYFVNMVVAGLTVLAIGLVGYLPLGVVVVFLFKRRTITSNCHGLISRCLQLQIPVVVVSVITNAVSSILIQDSVIKLVQMCFANVLFSVLCVCYAFETESSTTPNAVKMDSDLGRVDQGPLVSRGVIKNMTFQICYQAVVLVVLTLFGERIFGVPSGRYPPIDAPASQHFTLIFGSFVAMTLFNAFNARNVKGESSVFQRLSRNPCFCIAWILVVVAFVCLVQLIEGHFLCVVALDASQWIGCLCFGLGALLGAQIVNFIPVC